jgi:CRISPR/Cas system-associated endonuclease Cas1
MQSQGSGPRDGIAIVRGFGIKIRTSRGHLVVEDGICDERETRRFNRATGKLKRLVVIGQTGYITFDATRWLRDVGAALIQLDNRGQLVGLTTPGGPDLAALRRQQALAAVSPAGLELARWLLAAKVAGQQALLIELPSGDAAADAVTQALDDLDAAPDLPSLLLAESLAAEAYWEAWRELPSRSPNATAGSSPSTG